MRVIYKYFINVSFNDKAGIAILTMTIKEVSLIYILLVKGKLLFNSPNVMKSKPMLETNAGRQK